MVSRTGFTGDLGYELWMAPAGGRERSGMRLMAAGRSRGIRAIGSQALNIARIEAGFLDAERRFRVRRAHHSHRPRPLAARARPGLAGRFQEGPFHRPARAARRGAIAGPRRRLVGLDIAGNKPAHNALLYTDESGKREIGSVTSAIWSPTCKRNIALAMRRCAAFPDRLDGVGGHLS